MSRKTSADAGDARRMSINPSVYTFANPKGSQDDGFSKKTEGETGTEGTPGHFVQVNIPLQLKNRKIKDSRSNSVVDHLQLHRQTQLGLFPQERKQSIETKNNSLS